MNEPAGSMILQVGWIYSILELRAITLCYLETNVSPSFYVLPFNNKC